MIVAISQPMYMPWYGIFEQIKRSDIFVHYDDVQLPTSSSFMTRVQINSHNAIKWLTLPVKRLDGRHSMINRCAIVEDSWRSKHSESLRHAYSECPYFADAIGLFEEIKSGNATNLAEFTARSVEILSAYLGIQTKFVKSSELGIPGHGSQRILDICKALDATTYVTGLGALNYLDHQSFVASGIEVLYPEYACHEFRHVNSTFTPYVSILDFIAHTGEFAASLFNSKFTDWRLHISSNNT